MSDIKPDVVLDTKDMNCPLPVLKTKKAIDIIQSGQVLKVISTDKGSRSDIPALIVRLGHELIETKDNGDIFEFYIRKK